MYAKYASIHAYHCLQYKLNCFLADTESDGADDIQNPVYISSQENDFLQAKQKSVRRSTPALVRLSFGMGLCMYS